MPAKQQFISLTEMHRGKCSRTSSMILGGELSPDAITVIGNLPHGYDFQPTTAKDRDKLVEFLTKLEY
mgnify:CR=1 FL=1